MKKYKHNKKCGDKGKGRGDGMDAWDGDGARVQEVSLPPATGGCVDGPGLGARVQRGE